MYINKSLFKYNKILKTNGYYNMSDFNSINIYGEDAKNLINFLSVRDINYISEPAFYTVLQRGYIFIDEVLIIKLSEYNYIIYPNNQKKVQKIYDTLKFNKKKFPILNINMSSKTLALFSIHGNNNNEFDLLNSLYKTINITRQGYSFLLVYTHQSKKEKVINHFKENGLLEISVDIYNLFLYNNKVINNLENVSINYRLNVIKQVYNCDNTKIRLPKRILTIKLFEATRNVSLFHNTPIYNVEGEKIGYVYKSFYNPHKNKPFVIGIIKKYRTGKFAIVKNNDDELLLKLRNVYK